MESIPPNMRVAIGVGVGLFICFVGLKIGGIIIQNEATYLSIGDFKNSETILASFSFILIAILSVRKSPWFNPNWNFCCNANINNYRVG